MFRKNDLQVGNTMFVIKRFLPSASVTAVPAEETQTGMGALKIQLSDDQKQEEVTVWTVPENKGPKYEGSFDGIKIAMWIGPKEIVLPFSISPERFCFGTVSRIQQPFFLRKHGYID